MEPELAAWGLVKPGICRKLSTGFELDGIVFSPQRPLSPVQGPGPSYCISMHFGILLGKCQSDTVFFCTA